MLTRWRARREIGVFGFREMPVRTCAPFFCACVVGDVWLGVGCVLVVRVAYASAGPYDTNRTCEDSHTHVHVATHW